MEQGDTDLPACCELGVGPDPSATSIDSDRQIGRNVDM